MAHKPIALVAADAPPRARLAGQGEAMETGRDPRNRSIIAALHLAIAAASSACAASQPAPPVREAVMPERMPPGAVTRADCEQPPPQMRVSVARPMSADDMAKIARAVGASASAPIVRVDEVTMNGRAASEQTIRVEVWSGYDACLEFGTSSSYDLRRRGAEWVIVGWYKSYMH